MVLNKCTFGEDALLPQFLACIYHFAGKAMCTDYYRLLFLDFFSRRYFKDMPQIALDKKSDFDYIE